MKRRPIHPRPPLSSLVSLLAVVACQSASPSPQHSDPTFRVVEVIDGDTIELAVGDTVERVRLLGIDAPESVHPTVPEQCFGRESSAALRSLLPPGTEVEVFRDRQLRDHYGRLLLYLYRSEDGLNINHHLVASGLAATSFYEPNTHLQAELTRAERQAQRDRVGLWASCDGPDQPVT
ncbi:MAG: thermonuclease family protein [Acidimicrobiia bacterium]|nr:thermonuclease family protein [Acidimicrobiia bacterium]